MSKDLKAAFPKMSGFSSDNIRFMQRAYLFYSQQIPISAQVVQHLKKLQVKTTKAMENNESLIVAQLVQQLGGKDFFNLIVSIPWGHHTTILRKIKDVNEAIFYIRKTIENNWSRSVLEYQIETNLFHRLNNHVKGRPSGSKNKSTEKLQSFFHKFLETHILELDESFKQLDPRDKFKVLMDMARYVLPTMRAQGDLLSELTDDQFEIIIERIKQDFEITY